MDPAYSEIVLKRVDGFKMAKYVIISPNPEDDVIAYMEKWAEKSGLLRRPGYVPKRIGWDFPFVSKQQQEEFGLRGYVCAYVVPGDFEPDCAGAELADQAADDYAVITVTDPFEAPFEKIPAGYRRLFDFIGQNGLKARDHSGRICFEEVYEKDGVTFMDIYAPVDR